MGWLDETDCLQAWESVPDCEGFLRMQGKLGVRWLDETDCVGAWESDAMAAVVLPTANTLPQLKDMAAAGGGHRLLLVVNPQWQMDCQIVSDFGCACFQHIMCCKHSYQ